MMFSTRAKILSAAILSITGALSTSIPASAASPTTITEKICNYDCAGRGYGIITWNSAKSYSARWNLEDNEADGKAPLIMVAHMVKGSVLHGDWDWSNKCTTGRSTVCGWVQPKVTDTQTIGQVVFVVCQGGTVSKPVTPCEQSSPNFNKVVYPGVP